MRVQLGFTQSLAYDRHSTNFGDENNGSCGCPVVVKGNPEIWIFAPAISS
jgi:hypothetical protein